VDAGVSLGEAPVRRDIPAKLIRLNIPKTKMGGGDQEKGRTIGTRGANKREASSFRKKMCREAGVGLWAGRTKARWQ